MARFIALLSTFQQNFLSSSRLLEALSGAREEDSRSSMTLQEGSPRVSISADGAIGRAFECQPLPGSGAGPDLCLVSVAVPEWLWLMVLKHWLIASNYSLNDNILDILWKRTRERRGDGDDDDDDGCVSTTYSWPFRGPLGAGAPSFFEWWEEWRW